MSNTLFVPIKSVQTLPTLYLKQTKKVELWEKKYGTKSIFHKRNLQR